MTKLFLITLRWMKKDRKRTLLSFLSILLAVYMMTVLGIYFSSAVSFLRSKEKYENGSKHVSFRCDDIQQSEKIAGNAAVSESCSIYSADYGFIQSYLEKYGSYAGKGSVNYIPIFTLNGKTSLFKYTNSAAYISGDAEEMMSSQTLYKGRFPQQPGEITLYQGLAHDNKLDIGDTVVFRYEVSKGTVKYSEYTEKNVGSGNDQTIQRVYAFKDKPDDKGLIVNSFVTQIGQVYSKDKLSPKEKLEQSYQNISYLFTLSDKSSDRTWWNWGLGDEYTFDDTGKQYKLMYTAVAETEPQPVEVVEYSARIVGLSDPNKDNGSTFSFYFNDKDEAAKQLFPMCEGHCYARIKEGLDVDDEVEQIKKTVGLPDTYTDEHGIHDTAVLNDTLLFYEGRSLYNPDSFDPMLILGSLAVVLVVFVFFARLIINNAFELSSAYRLSQYSSLKTIGVSNKQMFVMIMGECILYLIAVLPIAIILAFATGKLIISKITELKIFDALYGSGVTDKFFRLEISPKIIALVLIVTVFSVLMSAYAVALRIVKMPAVLSRTGDGAKPPKAVRRSWLTRRLFGFSFGFAVKSAAGNKMRFFITLLASVVSCTLVIVISALIYAFSSSSDLIYEPDMPDYTCWITSEFSEEQNFSHDYNLLKSSCLFSDITMNERKTLCFTEPDKSIFTDSYTSSRKNASEPVKLRISAINQRYYQDHLKSDISYEKLVQKGGLLICSEVYETDDILSEYEDTGIKAIKDDAQKVTLNVTKEKPEQHNLEISGTYSFAHDRYIFDMDNFLHTNSSTVCAVVPIENYFKLLGWIKPDKDGLVTDYSGVFSEWSNLTSSEISLTAYPDKEEEAKEFLEDKFKDRMEIYDSTPEKHTYERISKALSTAGLSLAAIIFAVALINIVSTSATEIVNRRRELSMLRACGMSIRQIFKTLRLEVIFFSLISTIISAVLGTAISSLIFRFVSDGANYNGKMAYLPFTAMIIVFVLMLLLMMITYLLPLRNMSRSQIAQDIRMKE